MSMIMHSKNKLTSITFQVLTILLVSSSVISMFYLPIHIGNYWVDLRCIPLVFYAYFYGWKIAFPSLLIASIWRFSMGGDGMVPGIVFGMVGPTLLALAFHFRSKLEKHYFEKLVIIIGSWLICDVPIIFLIPNGIEIFKDIVFIRAASFIITSIIWYIFIMQNRQLQTLHNKLVKLAGEDPLTQLLNKREFFTVVNQKIKDLQPNHYIAMVDIDYFKQINDLYGHLAGDKVITDIASILKKYTSEYVQIGRYGGEEFIIYIGNATNTSATQLIHKIHKEIQFHQFVIDDNKPLNITASIGLALLENNSTLLHTINKADINLYIAKKNGRNRLVVS